MASVANFIKSFPKRRVLPFHSGLSMRHSKEKQTHSEAKAEERSRSDADPQVCKREEPFAQPLLAQAQAQGGGGKSMGWCPHPLLQGEGKKRGGAIERPHTP